MRKRFRVVLAASMAMAATIGGIGQAMAWPGDTYATSYWDNTCTRAEVTFKSDGEIWKISDKCADGHRVAVQTRSPYGWTNYYGGGANHSKTINASYPEGTKITFYACVEFGQTLKCGPGATAFA
ncbi:hypothetical protein OG530_21730 [Streptomyces decoyicus]|uniref:hypothetical protein n=1 Tax=Streptomyces decoyicus TaxID=249567 RepID=UPI002E1951D7